MVAFEQIRGDNVALIAGDRRQGGTSAGRGITRRIDCRVRHALQVFVDHYTALVKFPTRARQVQIADLWYPARTMHHHVSLERAHLAVNRSSDGQAARSTHNPFHIGLKLNVNTKVACPLYQLIDEIGVKASEGTGTSVENRDMRAGSRGDVRSEEHTSELQSLAYIVCRLLLEKKKELRLV